MTVDLLCGEGFPSSAMKVKGEGVPPLDSSGGCTGVTVHFSPGLWTGILAAPTGPT